MPPKLHISGQPVEFSTTAKYLGVTLDHNLTSNQPDSKGKMISIYAEKGSK